MAAEESSQGAALGPDFSGNGSGDPPTHPDVPDLHSVLGEFMVALSVVEMVSRALQELVEESTEEIGSCAVALNHGYQLLDAVYCRFDRGLLSYRPGDEDPTEDLDDAAAEACAPVA